MSRLTDLFSKLKFLYTGADIVGNTSPNSPLAATGYQYTSTNGTVYYSTIDNSGNLRVITTNAPVNDGDGSLVSVSLSSGQATAVANAASLSTQSGIITSSTTNLGAGTEETLTITNSLVKSANAVINAIIVTSGTGGTMTARVTLGANGTFTITTRNISASAMTSTYSVGYFIAFAG